MPTAQNHEYLKRQWKDLSAHCPNPTAVAVLNLLLSHYSESHRHYHTTDHIASLLSLAESMRDQFENYAAIRFAIWFHDAIYNPHKQDNEERSAELAVEKMTELAVDQATIPVVREMILATKGHNPAAASGDLKLFLDLDLSILGAETEAYRAYSAAIRQEYQWVPGFLYRRKRREILRSFLSRPVIFHSTSLRQKLEQQARFNLENELRDLSNCP